MMTSVLNQRRRHSLLDPLRWVLRQYDIADPLLHQPDRRGRIGQIADQDEWQCLQVPLERGREPFRVRSVVIVEKHDASWTKSPARSKKRIH